MIRKVGFSGFLVSVLLLLPLSLLSSLEDRVPVSEEDTLFVLFDPLSSLEDVKFVLVVENIRFESGLCTECSSGSNFTNDNGYELALLLSRLLLLGTRKVLPPISRLLAIHGIREDDTG